MSSRDSKILSILKRNGSSQSSRYRKDLDPDQLELMGFSQEDWILFAYSFAQKLHFYNSNNQIEGNWEKFFKELNLKEDTLTFNNKFELDSIKTNLNQVLKQYQNSGNLSPHLTLFVSFLNVLETSRSKFNQLTKKHLDFYYNEVLKMGKLQPSSDSVYVILELAKNALNQRIEANTTFNAGKNADGKPLIYISTEESSINSITLNSLRNIFHNQKDKKIKQAVLLDIDNGESEVLKNKQSWWTFGHTNAGDTLLEDPKFGFVLSSNVLLLKEGSRNINLELIFDKELKISIDEFLSCSKIFISTEKGWVELDDSQIDKNEDSTNPLALSIALENSFPSVVPFISEDPLLDALNIYPALKFLFDTSVMFGNKHIGYNVFQELSTKVIKKIRIQVQVQGIKNIQLENDQTTLNPQKPFYPFTTRPFKGSSFSFSYPEAFSKKCTSMVLKLDWKNTPDDFAKHYQTYVLEAKDNVTSKTFMGFLDVAILKKLKIVEELNPKGTKITGRAFSESVERATKESSSDETKKVEESESSVSLSSTKIINNDSYFRYKSELLRNGIVLKELTTESETLFMGEKGDFSLNIHIKKQIENIPNSKIRINLQQSFLHDIYPKIYAMVLTSEAENKILPNEPYTPLASDLAFDYDAEVEFSQDSDTNRIIHIHPFGYCKQDNKCFISSQYNQNGYLYLGMKNAQPNDILSILFQLDEGTEDPLSVDIDPVKWSILVKNSWKTLPEEAILLNETLNFLRSGMARIVLPPTLDYENTVFENGLIWIRVELKGNYNAVCRCINIHAQAVKLQALDPNKATHLPGNLESGVISKLERRVSQIKNVIQPYASFGGRGLESDQNYYRRTSERLRHKNRAITQWDYEHLILEEFPDLILVKCLNHTSPTCFNAPGHVTIVIVPSTRQFDIEKIIYPRVSSGKLEDIKLFISKYISPALEIHVVNPDYEKLQVTVDVKIHHGLDINFYLDQLNKDISNFLSPWAFEDNILLNFNKEFHKSQILYFIENLNYIDYISKLELKLENKTVENTVRPSSPKNIIVSDQQHRVNHSLGNCAKV